MTTTRRQFLATASAATAVAAVAPAAFGRPSRQDGKALKILVLGGTGFLGPHLIHQALERGHEVTMFNRGRTQPTIFVDQFKQVEALTGDRKDPEALAAALGGERTWDAVLDTSGYYPRVIDLAMDALKDRIGHYTFISTLSVYGERNTIDMDESAPVATIEDETVEEVTGQTYGALKALCEQKAEERMPGLVANIRPGLIVGKGDKTDRYTYWVDRMHRGGRVLCPGTGDDYTQIIDVRDLAEWTIRVAEARTAGVFNCVTPARGLTMRSMLTGCQAATDTESTLEWVDADFLAANGVAAWQHMTAWIPSSAPGYEGFGQISTDAAVKAGLTTRTAEDTAAATLAWWLTLPEERRRNRRAGLPSDMEKGVLEAWDGREG